MRTRTTKRKAPRRDTVRDWKVEELDGGGWALKPADGSGPWETYRGEHEALSALVQKLRDAEGVSARSLVGALLALACLAGAFAIA